MLRRKKFIFSLITLSLSAFLTLTLGETVVRLLARQNMPRSFNYFTMDSDFLFRPDHDYEMNEEFYSHHVRINSFGLRMNNEVDFAPDTKRVLALGDSFAFGWAVAFDSSFLGIVSSRVRKKYSNIQILNGTCVSESETTLSTIITVCCDLLHQRE